MWPVTFTVGSIRPSDIALIRYSRPRGDSASRPVATYVGQCCRQRPQRTHWARSASDGANRLVNAGCLPNQSLPTKRPGLRMPFGSNCCLTRRMSSKAGGGSPKTSICCLSSGGQRSTTAVAE